ncbi:MAG: argininosuccinate lyase [Ignavibacteria bacterium]|nr:argininosuccinate lyase [Ignavibacteria bacterium]
MKLWSKSSTRTDEAVERFTVGRDRELDHALAEYDVAGSLAHGAMLHSINLLTSDEWRGLQRELRNIGREVRAGKFQIEDGIEDVHSEVELLLTRRLGDTGKKIHSGRSRNDQVALDCKLFFREELRRIAQSTEAFFNRLISLADSHKNALLPGYTHLQIAMPSSFGLWFSAYAESLADDMIMLLAAYRITNKNPLGSAAGYGSSFPLNRRMTTELLGFDDLNYNVIYAQMGRGKTERIIAQALSSLAATLGKMAMDITLFMSQNFGFVSFPDDLTTGSSIMPHKKNPDVFELIRARCNRLLALPNEITLLTANLPSGYHRDAQLLKEAIFPAFESMKECLEIAEFALGQIAVRTDILDDERGKALYAYLFSVEVVNEYALQGMPFRDAYKRVGEDIATGNFVPSREIKHTHEGSIGNLCLEEITATMQRTISEFPFERVEQAMKNLMGDE